jgi:hypothetical protein
MDFHTSLDCLNKVNSKRLKAIESDDLDRTDHLSNHRVKFAEKHGKTYRLIRLSLFRGKFVAYSLLSQVSSAEKG